MGKNYFLSRLPAPAELINYFQNLNLPEFREANGHIHTPYSFSAFNDLQRVFSMARDENISLLGINDFYVTDGYLPFYEGCLANRIFPLFNIEFIGLMKEEQKKGIRINDPNNPGRIYFCGKGLDYPFHLGHDKTRELDKVKNETQNQLRAMVAKLNSIISNSNPALKLDFDEIKRRFAHELVRERHIAKALRILAVENYRTEEEQLSFIESLYSARRSKTNLSDPAALENEIRANLLKAGGAAFVEEDEHSFFDLERIIDIITEAGGIPCYPVLLDDPSGKCTEFETDREKLCESLTRLGVGCIELIPGRNDSSILIDFAGFFDSKGFIVTFGTEHNTPEMIPLTVTARAKTPLNEQMKRISWRGACVIAAHQYLRARGSDGYLLPDGSVRSEKREYFESLGKMVIEYYLNNIKHEI
jgi:regulator of replication initiation timing